MSNFTIDIRKRGKWGLAKKLMTELPKDVKRAISAVVFDEARSFQKKAKKAIRTNGASNNDNWPRSESKAEKSVLKTVSKAMQVKKLSHAKFALRFKGVGAYSAPLVHHLAMKQEKGSTTTQRVTVDMFRAAMARIRRQEGEVQEGKGKGTFKPGAIVVKRTPKRSFLLGTKKAHFHGSKYKREVYDKLHLKLIKYKEMRAN